MNLSEKMKQDWNRRAQHHARYWIATEDYRTEEVFARSGEATAQTILKRTENLSSPSWTVLDIGCGIGRVLKPLAPYFQKLVGVDVSSEMIDQSKLWLADHPHITTYATSGIDLQEFPNDYFDLVYSYVAFQHMPRPVFENYLTEINRVLKPERYFLFQLPLGNFSDPPLEDTIGIRAYPIPEIVDKLRRNGFTFDGNDLLPSKLSAHTHDFLFTQKIQHPSLAQEQGKISVEWIKLETCSQEFSPLDLHLYTTFAERSFSEGNNQEAIATLQSVVRHNPHHLSGWLHLANLLMETGQIEQALTTLQELTVLHPRYKEGHHTLHQLQTKLQISLEEQPRFRSLEKATV